MARIKVDGEWLDFAMDTVTNLEAMMVEDLTGWSVDKWGQQIAEGSARGLTTLIWILRRRNDPDLKFGDVVFNLTELEMEDDDEAPKDPGGEAAGTDETSTSTSSPDGATVHPLSSTA